MRTVLMTLAVLAFGTPAFAECTHGTYPDGSEVKICAGAERNGRDAANALHPITFGPYERSYFVGKGEDRHEVHDSVSFTGAVGNE